MAWRWTALETSIIATFGVPGGGDYSSLMAPTNNRIMKVNTAGIITTFAGGNVPPVAGNNFFGDGGLAISAGLNYPSSMAVDGDGNLYFADNGNNRIRKVTDGIITTIADNGTAPSKTGDAMMSGTRLPLLPESGSASV